MTSLRLHQVTPECLELGSETFPHSEDEDLAIWPRAQAHIPFGHLVELLALGLPNNETLSE